MPEHVFSMVPTADIPRSAFNRSHSHKTTFDAGWLIPFFVDEALPGDTFNVNASMFARLATPIVPLMDNMYLDVFFFAVPNRLLWSNWVKMMGEQENPGDSIDYLLPQVQNQSGTGWAAMSPGDYFGLPTGFNINVNALPFRAYNQVWNDWFRDENLQTRATKNVGDGPDAYTDYPLRKRGKRHDYFTSCLPWPQKTQAVSMFATATAPVKRTGVTAADWPKFELNGDTAAGVSNLQATTVGGTSNAVNVQWDPPNNMTGSAARALQWSTQTGLYADLAAATAATINQLREAFQIQKLLERDARGGTRYTEIVRSHFGVTSPDARMQRPEYLGGGSIPVIVNPVAQTSNTPVSGTPQGNLSAFGMASGRGIGFSKSFTEHCVLLGLVCARADLSYQQGVSRMWTRRTRYDFYWPAFAHLGEQAVLNKEIYYQNNGAVSDDAVFGYQERWAEYRYFPSKITGKFRSTHAQAIDTWHLGQEFSSLPVLGDTFIKEDPPVARVVAVPSEPHFLLDSFVSMRCVRPMPVYSVPGFIDRF